MTYPTGLQKGDVIALLSPSSPLSAEESVEEIAAKIEELGYRTWIGDSCRGSAGCGYSAAPAETRARDIHRAFADPNISAVWCTRGGSTAWQVLPLLDYDLIAANPKAFIGFSDVTTLHMALRQRCNFVTYHGPNANRILKWGEKDRFSWHSLCKALEMRATLVVENPADEPIVVLRPGTAEGELVGGNLSLVTASLGTPWQIDAKGHILYLEDLGEEVYALDRMLYQLQYAGVLESAAGIVLGAFTNCQNTYCSEYNAEALLREFFCGWKTPILYNVRSAHCDPMVTLPLGAWCKLDGMAGTITLC